MPRFWGCLLSFPAGHACVWRHIRQARCAACALPRVLPQSAQHTPAADAATGAVRCRRAGALCRQQRSCCCGNSSRTASEATGRPAAAAITSRSAGGAAAAQSCAGQAGLCMGGRKEQLAARCYSCWWFIRLAWELCQRLDRCCCVWRGAGRGVCVCAGCRDWALQRCE